MCLRKRLSVSSPCRCQVPWLVPLHLPGYFTVSEFHDRLFLPSVCGHLSYLQEIHMPSHHSPVQNPQGCSGAEESGSCLQSGCPSLSPQSPRHPGAARLLRSRLPCCGPEGLLTLVSPSPPPCLSAVHISYMPARSQAGAGRHTSLASCPRTV